MNGVVRRYRPEDLVAVNKILYESFKRTKSNFEGEEFCEVVVEVDSKVVGYLLLTKVRNPIIGKIYILVDYVCVVSEYRGYGLGERLLEYAENYAKKEGAMYLQLTCRWTRIQAHQLYEKCGFKKRESDIFRKELL